MATGGIGSQLIIRAREAAARAQAASLLGIPGPSKLVPPSQGVNSPAPGPVRPAQPIQPASTDVSVRDKMYAETEQFLKQFYEGDILDG